MLRWVDATARGALASKTHKAPDHETNLHAPLELGPSKAKLTKAKELKNIQHPHHQAQIALKAKPLEIHKYAVESEGFSVHNSNSRAIFILQQQNQNIPRFVGTVSDDLGGFVKYCTKTPRRSIIECCLPYPRCP